MALKAGYKGIKKCGPGLKYDNVNGILSLEGESSLKLDNLEDVEITTPLQGDVLVYDGEDWVNEQPDTDPTEDSANLVTSGGVYDALQARVDWSSYAKTGVHQLLLMKLDTIKALNTSGTWADNAYTWQDVTYTVQTDANGYVTGVQVNGLASGRGWLFLSENELSGVNVNLTAATGNIVNGIKLLGGDYTFDKQDIVYASGSKKSYILIDNGETLSNKMFYPVAVYEYDVDTSVTPYAMTNGELTEAVTINAASGITFNSTYCDTANSSANVRVVGKVVFANIQVKITTAVPEYTKFIDNLPDISASAYNTTAYGTGTMKRLYFTGKGAYPHAGGLPVDTYNISFMYMMP